MKILALCVFGLVLMSSSSTELKAKLRNAVETINDDTATCMTENNVNRNDIYQENEIINDEYKRPENEERSRKIGCWIACILRKQNLMEGSNIKEAQIHAKISELFVEQPDDEGIAQKMARTCMKRVRNITQECEKSFSLFTCVMKAVHDIQKQHEHEREKAREAVIGEATTEQTQ